MIKTRTMATITAAVICQFTLPKALWASSIDQDQDPERIPYKSVIPLLESTVDRTALVAARRIATARFELHRKILRQLAGNFQKWWD